MKYPRTYHLPWSPGKTSDDKVLQSIANFIGIPLIITEKLDGGNACITKTSIFARTHSKKAKHNSFDWLKAYHSQIAYNLPENLMFFGENMFARHSILYNGLTSLFYLFGVYDNKKNMWSSWTELKEYSKLLNFPCVPLLWEGIVKSENELNDLINMIISKGSIIGGKEIEGVVIRNSDGFTNDEFQQNLAKWVRSDHVQTDDEWHKSPITRNKLINE